MHSRHKMVQSAAATRVRHYPRPGENKLHLGKSQKITFKTSLNSTQLIGSQIKTRFRNQLQHSLEFPMSSNARNTHFSTLQSISRHPGFRPNSVA